MVNRDPPALNYPGDDGDDCMRNTAKFQATDNSPDNDSHYIPIIGHASVKHRTTTISEFYSQSLAAASRAKIDVERQTLQRGQGGLSIGEDELRHKVHEVPTSISQLASNVLNTSLIPLENSNGHHENNASLSVACGDDRASSSIVHGVSNKRTMAESSKEVSRHRESISDHARLFIDFLTCRALRVCNGSDTYHHESSVMKYEIPLQSIPATMDEEETIGGWQTRMKRQVDESSTKPSKKIAQAVDFSSKRLLDNKNAAVMTLFDEGNVPVPDIDIPPSFIERRSPVLTTNKHFIATTHEHDRQNDEADDSFDFLLSQHGFVPQAIVVKSNFKSRDDVSVLEDSVFETLAQDQSRDNQAWSLSPRRKRRLKARARAAKLAQ